MEQRRWSDWATAIMGVIFIIIGIFTFFLSIFIIKTNNEKLNDFISTTGTITKIESYLDNNDELSYRAYVKYTVKGRVYEDYANFYSTWMKEGNNITVYYDSDFPSEFKVEGENLFTNIIIISMGCGFILVGVRMIKDFLKTVDIKKHVLKEGEKVEAQIKEIYINENCTINGKHPYIIVCEWIHPSTGVTHKFKSKRFLNNPEKYLIGKTTMNVYVDMENPKMYYVDTEEIEEMIRNKNYNL